MDASVIISFVLMSLLYVVPFFFIYALAKNLERYFSVKSKLFVIGATSAIISFVLLVLDSSINPAFLELGSGIYLSALNLTGTFFSTLASVCFYTLTEAIKKAMNMRQRGISSGLFFITIFFALYYTLSLTSMQSGTALSMSLNLACTLASFLILFFSFLNLSEIYGAFCSWCRVPVLIASYLTLWNAFYQTFAFLNYVIPVEIMENPILYDAQTGITLIIIILLTVPAWSMFKSLRVKVKNGGDEISLFLNRMSTIIGGSTITILKRAIDEYNRDKGTSISYDPEKGVNNSTADFVEFMVSYFEDLIGPVTKRIFAESTVYLESK